jgi:hypothetical protein
MTNVIYMVTKFLTDERIYVLKCIEINIRVVCQIQGFAYWRKHIAVDPVCQTLRVSTCYVTL